MTGDEITDMLEADQLQARVDMDWLRELANTEKLWPAALRDAETMSLALSQRIRQLTDPNSELRRLLLKRDDVGDRRHMALEDFWLRLGLELGAQLQWAHDNAELLRAAGHGWEVDDLQPSSYMAAIVQAARWMDAEGEFTSMTMEEWLDEMD